MHNDIKLENAILGPGMRICLIDFGSSREPVRTSIFVRFFRKAHSTLGTAAYLAPQDCSPATARASRATSTPWACACAAC